MTYTASLGENDVYELTYTGNPVAMGVKSVISQDTNEAYTPGKDVDNIGGVDGPVDYVVRYFEDWNNNGIFDKNDKQLTDENGDPSGYVAPTKVGNYFVVAMDEAAVSTWGAKSGDYANAEGLVNGDGTKVSQGVIAQYFKVVPRSLEGAQVVNEAGTSEFTYDAASQDIMISLDGKILEEGKDYSLRILAANGTDVTATGAINAGEYTAVVTGKGGYQSTKTDNKPLQIKFTVDKLNLSTAEVFAEDLEAGSPVENNNLGATVLVNGVSVSELWQDIERTQTSYSNARGYTSAPDTAGYKDLVDTMNAPDKGGYGFKLTAKANASTGNVNVTGSVDFTQNVCKEIVDAGDFLYDGTVLFDESDPSADFDGTVFDLSEGEAYDASKISVKNHKASEYTVSLATADAATAGEYTVSVKMNVPDNYSIGGGSSASFTVLNGIIDSSSVEAVVLIDGVNYDFGETYTATYVPEGVEPNVTIKAGKTVLTEGEDYDVVYTDSTGAEVETMVDAGEYTVTVNLKNGYLFSDGSVSKSLEVQINQRKINVALDEDFVLNTADNTVDSDGKPVNTGNDVDALLYTGSEIAPQFVGTYTAGGKDFEVVLDSSWYDVTGIMFMAPAAEKFVPAESILEAGEYEVNLTPAAACKNYTWDNKVMPVKFEVVKAAKFADVPSDAWYADSVLSASANGYMNGFAGTNLFGPLAEISRAEVAQVFYNMAGATSGNWATNDFTDVEQSDWFASAVAWASAYGIVTGYEGTDAFGPSDDATREQVATMIYRYAKAQGMDVTVEDEAAALVKYSDGASVSEYAKTAMAYCVEQGIFGVDVDTLRPQDNLSRAEMAATSVRVQPEGAKEIL